MNSLSYYLRKGEKAIGPLTFARIIELRDQGKIQSESMIATSGKGPWMTLGELEESLAEPVPANHSPQNEGFGGMDLRALIPTASPSMNIPLNSPYAATQPSPYLAPAHHSSRSTSNRARESKTIETEEASTFTRLFMPWAGENSESRYGNLERYITFFKWATRVGFLIGAVLLAILTVILSVALVLVPIQKLTNSSMEMADAEMAFVSRLGGLVLIILYFALLHLAYIASMALVDFVRLMIDIEGNTRKER